MTIKKYTKEDLELMSYTDIANILLKENNEQSTADLFKEIVKLLELPKKTYENKIGDFYTSLTTDKRFVLLKNGNWDLKSNHPSDTIKIADDLEEDIETDEVFDDSDDDSDEDKEIIYDENPDDDLEDVTEEYKNLVIVDEEDLDIE